MPVSITNLSDRQWTQVRAALVFWKEIAEKSRVHPSRHPVVESLFRLYGPLSVGEIDELLMGTPESLYTDIPSIAKACGRGQDAVKNGLDRHGIVPDFVAKKCKYYRVDKLDALIGELHAKVTGR